MVPDSRASLRCPKGALRISGFIGMMIEAFMGASREEIETLSAKLGDGS